MSHLIVHDLKKRYSGSQSGEAALRGVSFTVAAGEFVALRGPSGCGKSTLLHILGAMDRPDAGTVTLAERRIDHLDHDALARIRREQIGFVFQSFNLLPTLTAADNVCLPYWLQGESDRVAHEKAREALALVGLQEKVRSFPSQLSGGEMQRVAIARALAMCPELLLADEPTGSLDSENGQKVLELMSDLNQTRQLTIIMATHSEEAARFASRTLKMHDGQLVASPNVVSASV